MLCGKLAQSDISTNTWYLTSDTNYTQVKQTTGRMEEAELMANPDLLKPLTKSKRQELATLTRSN